ncbi:MAG: DUF692 family protein, partial [Deltaproteobacteria bacterium]
MADPKHPSRPGPDLGVGLGLRVPHLRHILTHHPDVDFFEIISENFMVEGGPPLRNLDAILERYRVVLHGVSMGLGSAGPLDRDHLSRLVALARRTKTPWVSEHLCWTKHGNAHLHDLLPLPYTDAVAAFIADKAAFVQDSLGLPFAIENLSSYVGFSQSQMPEWEFYRQVVERADCFMMLDVNNVFVSSVNHGFDPWDYLAAIPWDRVIQVHVAGHTVRPDGTLLDTHDHPVRPEVWELYRHASEQTGGVSTILEWDDHFLPFPDTLAEAVKARAYRPVPDPDRSTPRVQPGERPEPAGPADLRTQQAGFAASITTPLQIDDDGYSYNADRYDPDTVASMLPGPTLAPVDRLSIYNQQYWFRLLTIAQDELPLTRRLLGLTDLNRLTTAYLDAFPSAHPELHHLLERLPRFLAGDHRFNRPLLRQAVDLDLLHQRVFFAATHEDLDAGTLSGSDLAALRERPLHFQPAFGLFAEDWPLVELRTNLLAGPDSDAIVPAPAPRKGWWAIYRTPQAGFGQERLDPVQFDLLRLLMEGRPLPAALDALTADLPAPAVDRIARGLQGWFARWAGLGWFSRRGLG